MKSVSKIFSVFLAFSVLIAVSYCCCIKEVLAKETHSCCAQKSSPSADVCHHKDQACPKIVSLFNDQSAEVKQISLPQLTIVPTFQNFSKISLSYDSVHSVFDGPPVKSSEVPLYITQHNFRI